MEGEMVKTALSAEASELLKWCVYVGAHLQDDGWLILFRFENGLQASVVYGPHSNGLSVGVMDGDKLVEVTDWLDGQEVMERLIEVMNRVCEKTERNVTHDD